VGGKGRDAAFDDISISELVGPATITTTFGCGCGADDFQESPSFERHRSESESASLLKQGSIQRTDGQKLHSSVIMNPEHMRHHRIRKAMPLPMNIFK
jgi:hypothetical protein